MILRIPFYECTKSTFLQFLFKWSCEKIKFYDSHALLSGIWLCLPIVVTPAPTKTSFNCVPSKFHIQISSGCHNMLVFMAVIFCTLASFMLRNIKKNRGTFRFYIKWNKYWTMIQLLGVCFNSVWSNEYEFNCNVH